MVIGREASTNVNLVLKIPTVSSTHAMIDFIDGEFFLTDLSSTNGTFVNGAAQGTGHVFISIRAVFAWAQALAPHSAQGRSCLRGSPSS